MLQGMREMVHWVDALLHVDCTRAMCEQDHAVVEEWLHQEKEAEVQQQETGKQTMSFLRDAIVAVLPKVVEMIGSADSKSSKPIHVAREERPVVVDREEQVSEARRPVPPQAPTQAPKVIPPEVIEQALRQNTAAIHTLDARLKLVEEKAVKVEKLQELSKQLVDLEEKLRAAGFFPQPTPPTTT